MRVLFDCRYVRTERHDGISRFSAELVARLGQRADVTMLVHDPAQLAMLPNLPHVLGPSPTGPLEPIATWRLRHVDVDVVYSPMQTIGSLGRRTALVATVHDLIYYRHPMPPRDLPAPVRALWRLYHLSYGPQRLLLRGADATVVVSETTAALVREHRLTTKPIHVVRNAAEPLGEPVTHAAPPTRRLVYMGSFMPYKGVDTLVRMAALLPDHELHLLSRMPAGEEARLRELAPTARIVVHDGVTDAEYADMLRSATALVHASHDEGFGIPLLESMALGVPVVVSDIPIFREVAGDAGAYAPVGDAQGFADAVLRLEGEWAARSAASRTQAARFSWDASADALHAALAATVAARRDR
ncbi:glycosyltransferase family 4 protein [Agrococcus sp. SGAir0287]|uniref:glycosyltransferase family 4 protein n=1 Tax=Agrococcus sp. SGAir0287 TaxID=2070347 RepID=UPI0010CD599B|nr:glycosyltransferase family 1 protein [Agrococcus sp. SGAir0287]QCR19228.1 mannosyltransferase [Agrococcus sp. SGAir0287]